MTLKPGWINRQFARVERDAKTWPEWMRRETELRAERNRRTQEEIQRPMPLAA
jgi:hypothetical protein